MNRVVSCLGFIASLLVLSVAPVWAQPPRGFGPGGGGFGPLGGGPAALFGGAPMGAAADSAAAILWMPEVQRELGLTDEQTERVNDAYQALREEMRASFEGIDFERMNDLSDEEREKQFAQAGKRSEKAGVDAERSFADILEPAQAKRLRQLQLQRGGARALLGEDVVEDLKLTERQRAEIEKLVPRELAFGGFGPPAAPPQVSADVLAVLNGSQRGTWNSLVGSRFTFPEPRGGFGGPGGAFAETREILADYDENDDGWLNQQERKRAREALAKDGGQRARGPFGGGPFGGGPRGGDGPRDGRGGRGGPFGRVEPGTPGPHVGLADVAPLESTDLYDPAVVRTLFLEFENDDWEAELEAFHGTDVDVPATLTVDGNRYANVGVRFRGMSSYMMLPAGSKRSLNVSLDLDDDEQRLYGYKTLNLLNSHEDPTFLHTVLYSEIARQYIAAPKANFVRVVINGESWGVYVNAQQFDKIFAAENFGDGGGTRWKVSGSPGADGGLRFLGDDPAEYRRRYEIKGDDSLKAWRPLIELCRTLNETPTEELEAALAPMLDIEGALWFLALDNALINGDGYWLRASDYSLYRDVDGKFHVIPHDMNEAFQGAMGPGRGGPGGRGRGPRGFAGGFSGGPGGFGGPRGGSYELDPLVGLDDQSKPLRGKLLAVPALRERYLAHMRELAERQLDWERLSATVARYVALIEPELEADTRKLSSIEEFEQSLSEAPAGETAGRHSLYEFARRRREYLLREAADSEAKP
jgi:hypothetical protein